MIDIIKMDVPVFIRLLELAKEDVKDDADLHDLAEIITYLSSDHIVTMHDYKTIVEYMKSLDSTPTDSTDTELNDIKRLGGI